VTASWLHTIGTVDIYKVCFYRIIQLFRFSDLALATTALSIDVSINSRKRKYCIEAELELSARFKREQLSSNIRKFDLYQVKSNPRFEIRIRIESGTNGGQFHSTYSLYTLRAYKYISLVRKSEDL
jgi:hypothetical protein